MAIQINAGKRTEKFCLKLEGSIANNPTNPVALRQKTGMLGRLMAPENRNAWDFEIIAPGKNRPGTGSVKAYAEYLKPYTTGTSYGEASLTVCSSSPATTSNYKNLELSIDKVAGRPFTIGPDEFVDICEDPDNRRSETIDRFHYQIIRDINKEAITAYYSLADDYPVAGASPLGAGLKNVNLIDEDGHIRPVGYSKIIQTFRQANYDGGINLVGDVLLSGYMDAVKLAGRAQDRGDALTEAFRYLQADVATDMDLDSTFNDLDGTWATNSFVIAFPHGSMTIVFWNEFTGKKEIIMEDYLQTTINYEGIPYDLQMKFEPCNGNNYPEWNTVMKTHYAFAYIPAAEYQGGKGLKYIFGVTGDAAFSLDDVKPA